jgi:cytochrome c-type biogenesis protein
MLDVLLALLAGVLTVGAPCILPVLPILLGSSVGRTDKLRPAMIALGFVVSFSAAALLLSYAVSRLHLAPDLLRNAAIIALALFGVAMVWPKPFELITARLSGLITKASQTGQRAGTGALGGLVLGLMLGVIWTPCAGPVLGFILTLIATQQHHGQAAILLVAYAIGAGVPMLLIAYGGQLVSSRVKALANHAQRVQQIFGLLIILLAAAMYFQYDLLFQAWLLERYNFSGLESQVITPIRK